MAKKNTPNSFVSGIVEAVENLEDGSVVDMRTIVRRGEFMLRIDISDGINEISADMYGQEAEDMYKNLLKAWKGEL